MTDTQTRPARRTATYDLDAERGLLGALPISPHAIPIAMRNLDPSDFYDPAHAVIYGRMIDVFGATGVLDPGTLVHEMERHGELAGRVDRRFVLQLIGEGVPVNYDGYVRRILEAATRRRLDALAATLHEKAGNVTVDVADALDEARSVLHDLSIPILHTDPSPTIEEFCGPETPVSWIVRDLIEAQDRIMVTAGEGAGKSMLLRQIVVMAAAGLHPFNWSKIPPVRSLLLDFESSEALVRRKLRPLMHRAQEILDNRFDPANVRVECRPAGIDLTRRADQAWFLGRLAACRPQIVACGPLYKMYVGDMNEEQTARKVADVLDDARQRFGCAFLIETHAPHGEGKRIWRPTGSSLWLRWPELGLALVETNRKWELTRWRKPRDDRSWPVEVKRGDRWPWESV